jgi:hypothetical protein
MAKEVISPISSTHPGPSKVSGGQPLSPGARSDPGRRDSVPERSADQEPAASLRNVEPEE